MRIIPPRHLTDEVQRAIQEGHSRIAVSGGDGSIAAAASRLAGSSTALVPIPTGTLNNFSRRLGIARPAEAVEALRGGRVTTVPTGVLDDRIFLNTATFGLYADVVRRRERLRPLLSKWPAAVIGFLHALIRMRRLEAVVLIEGEHHRFSTPLLWVGVGWGSFPSVVEATERRRSPDLEIVVLSSTGRLGALALAWRIARHLLWGKRPIQDRALRVMHARSLLIHAPHAVGITLDGEVLRGVPPLYVGVQDDALRVVVRSAAED
jgi:diacylglycerol kinase family enzyme